MNSVGYAMCKIKICGLFRDCDIEYVNEAEPDFCGFVVNFPKSHRGVTPERVRAMRARLSEKIIPVGVFVNEPQETIVAMVREGSIAMVQLHGQEDENYLATLRTKIHVPIIKAFQIRSRMDVVLAEKSTADHILMDNGTGTGARFEWNRLEGMTRPFILAGGLNPENLTEAIRQTNPWAVDLSSGVETDRKKDPEKMIAAVQAVRGRI